MFTQRVRRRRVSRDFDETISRARTRVRGLAGLFLKTDIDRETRGDCGDSRDLQYSSNTRVVCGENETRESIDLSVDAGADSWSASAAPRRPHPRRRRARRAPRGTPPPRRRARPPTGRSDAGLKKRDRANEYASRAAELSLERTFCVSEKSKASHVRAGEKVAYLGSVARAQRRRRASWRAAGPGGSRARANPSCCGGGPTPTDRPTSCV